MMSYLNNQLADCQSNLDGRRRDKDHFIRLLLTFLMTNRDEETKKKEERQTIDNEEQQKKKERKKRHRQCFSEIQNLEPPADFVCSTRNEGNEHQQMSSRY